MAGVAAGPGAGDRLNIVDAAAASRTRPVVAGGGRGRDVGARCQTAPPRTRFAYRSRRGRGRSGGGHYRLCRPDRPAHRPADGRAWPSRTLASVGGRGALLVSFADLVARLIALPAEAPAGVVMALAGAPVFIALLLRGREWRT
ncbi:MAG: iron chelate uptake ABC transporter family permease subunit [Sphingopyxis sp.]|nr:iron chelate uptake ABC transporter family permease subunit [Sphingopyxis sp.]